MAHRGGREIRQRGSGSLDALSPSSNLTVYAKWGGSEGGGASRCCAEGGSWASLLGLTVEVTGGARAESLSRSEVSHRCPMTVQGLKAEEGQQD